MTQKWVGPLKKVGSLKNKSGRSLDERLKLVKKAGPATEKERRKWLKKEHALEIMRHVGSPT